MAKPSYKSLEVFESVARLKSYSKAAEFLCIDYTGVSKHIKSLESYYNLRLIGGSGRNLELTKAGEDIAERLRVGFEAINSACAVMRDNPKLEIKIPVTFGLRWFLENFPKGLLGDNASFHIAWKHSVDFFVERFDLAITFSDQVSDSYFYKERLVTVAKPDYLARLGAGMDPKVINLEGALFVSPSISKADWYTYFARSEINASIMDETEILIADSMNSALDIVERIGGITVVDILYVKDELNSGKLVTVFDYVVETGLGYKLECPKEMEDSKVYRNFYEWLCKHPLLVDPINEINTPLKLIAWNG